MSSVALLLVVLLLVALGRSLHVSGKCNDKADTDNKSAGVETDDTADAKGHNKAGAATRNIMTTMPVPTTGPTQVAMTRPFTQ